MVATMTAKTSNWILTSDVLVYTGQGAQDGNLHLLVVNKAKLGARWPQLVRYQHWWWRWSINEKQNWPDILVPIWGHGSYTLVHSDEKINEDEQSVMYLD